jgi:hypothetical protein
MDLLGPRDACGQKGRGRRHHSLELHSTSSVGWSGQPDPCDGLIAMAASCDTILIKFLDSFQHGFSATRNLL